ncbi:hypothetical protein BDV32DRAFT_126668 [Aspergillus pseudonomiae]|nr:hypothetical protein BDV32DRAFT_126668 [Aspergillus pseudonomiae]
MHGTSVGGLLALPIKTGGGIRTCDPLNEVTLKGESRISNYIKILRLHGASTT